MAISSDSVPAPSSGLSPRNAQFGTAPVFLTAISTILGAVMFLRFGFAVGNVGLLGTIGIILIGHLVTIATAMAIAEIATNQKVEGGGEYYIISRSFGINVGGAIGLALYLSQAISVAFYIIAFAQAFEPLYQWVQGQYGFLPDSRFVSVPALLLLGLLMFTRGADLGVKALYGVVAILFLSLVMFFWGETDYAASGRDFTDIVSQTVEDPVPFFTVFAIIFPAFTGMTAGVGLSGDLKDPKKSLPLGTLSATVAGMGIYVFIAYKLASSASPEDLASDQLIMSRIALWGPIILFGLAAATLSSALGSIMVAPRTLQAISKDNILPTQRLNDLLSKGTPAKNEPVNATLLTTAIALVFILLGDVNVVAKIISMFFMVTYGSICLISFLEHFAADPSYRPAFRSRWYLSLLGAVLCLWLMFMMNPLYAFLSILIMVVLYILINRYNQHRSGLATIFREVMSQVAWRFQVFLQDSAIRSKGPEGRWRPSVLALSSNTFGRYHAFELLRWISRTYGFGTYLHLIKGYLSQKSSEDAVVAKAELIKMVQASQSNVYLETMVSPSFTSAIAQAIQMPGISGRSNNFLLFEYLEEKEGELEAILENLPLVSIMEFDIGLLRGHQRGFGLHREIHIWLNVGSYGNANLMILLAYIVLGHPDWHRAEMKIFSVAPEEKLEKERERLLELIHSGRLPISPKNVELIPAGAGQPIKELINGRSGHSDLTLIGFPIEVVRREETDFFSGYEQLGNILFVSGREEKVIS